MLYKAYGRTGKKISVVSAGGMRFENPEDVDTNAAMLLHAHSKGVNYFDTSPGYCNDKSEDIVGAAVRQMTPGTFYLSTKCASPDGGKLRETLERSLEWLGVDTIDFFHIWCLITPAHWAARKAGGAVAAALKAKDEGLIDHLAFSSHMAGREIAEVIQEGIFEGVTLGYSAINFPFRQAALDAAAAGGLGVVTMNPLGGGVIPSNPDRLDFLRAPDDPSVVAAAIRFNISHSAVTSALVGFSSIDHVDQAVAAAENFAPYDGDHVAAMKRRIEESFDGLCTGCGYCLPCPEGLEIPKLMDAYNHKTLASFDDPIVNRLRWHWSLTPAAADGCSQCGQCEQACTQQLPIVERISEIAELNTSPKP